MPCVTQVAKRKLKKLRVFGNDYPIVDGSGVRDYIDVVDLVEGHVAAIEKLTEACISTISEQAKELQYFNWYKSLKKLTILKFLKMRIELVSIAHASGDSFIFVMSFHYSEWDFKESDFPYKKGRGEEK